MTGWIAEFKAFALKGNLVDLAVAFILGVAFAAVVTSLVENIFMPLIGAIFSTESLTTKTFTIGDAVFGYGAFVATLIDFILVALVLFLVIKLYNRYRAEEEATTKSCEFCASSIPIAATRCPHCTSELTTAA